MDNNYSPFNLNAPATSLLDNSLTETEKASEILKSLAEFSNLESLEQEFKEQVTGFIKSNPLIRDNILVFASNAGLSGITKDTLDNITEEGLNLL